EQAGLENRSGGNSTVGSNPTLSVFLFSVIGSQAAPSAYNGSINPARIGVVRWLNGWLSYDSARLNRASSRLPAARCLRISHAFSTMTAAASAGGRPPE